MTRERATARRRVFWFFSSRVCYFFSQTKNKSHNETDSNRGGLAATRESQLRAGLSRSSSTPRRNRGSRSPAVCPSVRPSDRVSASHTYIDVIHPSIYLYLSYLSLSLCVPLYIYIYVYGYLSLASRECTVANESTNE